MIVLIGSQKGGCGKSTTAVNVCALLANQGRDVLLVDADRQCTSANWAMDRAENKKLAVVNCAQRYENIREALLDFNKRYEFVIVDAAGRDSRELRTGMTAADILLIPFRPSQPDLDTLPKMKELIIQAKDLNSKLKTFAVLTMAPTNPVVKEDEESREYLCDYPELTLLNSSIYDRKVYRDAMSNGFGVVEMDNGKAKEEVLSVVEEVLNA